MLLDTCTYPKNETYNITSSNGTVTAQETRLIDVQVTPHDLPIIIKEAEHMIWWVYFLRYFLWIMIYA